MSVFTELKRRNVFRVAVAYAIGSWFIAQIADLFLGNIGAPNWVILTLFMLMAMGFVVALVVSWAYELTPEGLKRESEVVRDESITNITAKKLDYITLAAAIGIAGMFAWQQFDTEKSPITPDPNAGELDDGTVVSLAKLGTMSIAVLPFANRSNLDDDLFFTDGIHDDLLTQLAKIKDLKVISRTSVMQYRGTIKKIPEIAGELGVAKVLEGGVQRAGQRIRINAQLIDVVTDEHLWAETFDREMTIDNLFDIQTEITRQIVTQVKGQMTPEDQQVLATAPTQSVAAYEAFLHARELIRSSGYNMEKFKAAQPIVEQAISLDANFGLAYLLLAYIHGEAYWIGYDATLARRQAAQEALDRAATLLGSDAPELLASRGRFLYSFDQNYPGALNALLKAHAAMPGNVETLISLSLAQRRLGLWEEAVANMLQAAELDPARVSPRSLVIETLLYTRQWSQAEKVLVSARARFPDDTDLAISAVLLPLVADGDVNTARKHHQMIRPNAGEAYVIVTTDLPWYERDFAGVINAWTLPEVLDFASTEGNAGFRELALAQAYQQLGDTDRADQLLDEAIESLAELDSNRRGLVIASELSTLAIALALKGEKARAIEIAEEATRVHPLVGDKLEGPWPLQWLCYVLALTGEHDRALELLTQLIDEPGGLSRWELYLDPRWDFLRDDERFNKIIRPHNLEQSIHDTQSGSH